MRVDIFLRFSFSLRLCRIYVQLFYNTIIHSCTTFTYTKRCQEIGPQERMYSPMIVRSRRLGLFAFTTLPVIRVETLLRPARSARTRERSPAGCLPFICSLLYVNHAIIKLQYSRTTWRSLCCRWRRLCYRLDTRSWQRARVLHTRRVNTIIGPGDGGRQKYAVHI